MLFIFSLSLNIIFFRVFAGRYSQEVFSTEYFNYFSHLHDKLEYNKFQLFIKLIWLLGDILLLVMQLKVDHIL